MAETALASGIQAASDAPLLKPYLQGMGGWTQAGGAFASLGVGAHITSMLSVYADAGWQKQTGWMTGMGARVDF